MKKILATPCHARTKSKFKFAYSTQAAEHNWNLLQQYGNLGEALEADKNSLLGYGSEFRNEACLEPLFNKYPLWPRMQKILQRGISYPLSPLSTEQRAKDLADGLNFGNHKGVTIHKKFFNKLIQSKVLQGYSLLLPLHAATEIKDALIAPHNVVEQYTITATGEIVEKLRMTHNQSKVFSSGTSVNSRVNKDTLQDCMYGFCITRLIHYILALR